MNLQRCILELNSVLEGIPVELTYFNMTKRNELSCASSQLSNEQHHPQRRIQVQMGTNWRKQTMIIMISVSSNLPNERQSLFESLVLPDNCACARKTQTGYLSTRRHTFITTGGSPFSSSRTSKRRCSPIAIFICKQFPWWLGWPLSITRGWTYQWRILRHFWRCLEQCTQVIEMASRIGTLNKCILKFSDSVKDMNLEKATSQIHFQHFFIMNFDFTESARLKNLFKDPVMQI